MKLIKPVFAAIENPLLKDSLNKQIQNSPEAFTNSVVQTIFSVFLLVAVIYFVWHFLMAAFHYISSEGDSKKVEDAKHALTYAILGLGISFAVFAILKVIGYIFGVEGLDQLQLQFPKLGV